MQLILFHGWRYNHCAFTTDDLKLFFEGNALNCAENYLNRVAIPILIGSDSGELSGSAVRYSVQRERLDNGKFWGEIGAPVRAVKFRSGRRKPQ